MGCGCKKKKIGSMGKNGKNVTITSSDVGYTVLGAITAIFTNWGVNKAINSFVPEDYKTTAKRVAIGTKVIGGGTVAYKAKDRRVKMAALGFTAVSTVEAGMETAKVIGGDAAENFALLSGVEDIYTHIGDPSTDTVTLNIEPGAADTGMFKETAILGTQQEALTVL